MKAMKTIPQYDVGDTARAIMYPTPQKPPSDLESLQKFMAWMLINID